MIKERLDMAASAWRATVWACCRSSGTAVDSHNVAFRSVPAISRFECVSPFASIARPQLSVSKPRLSSSLESAPNSRSGRRKWCVAWRLCAPGPVQLTTQETLTVRVVELPRRENVTSTPSESAVAATKAPAVDFESLLPAQAIDGIRNRGRHAMAVNLPERAQVPEKS